MWGFHLIGPLLSHLGLFTILHWFDLRGGEGSMLNYNNLLWNKVLPYWPLIPLSLHYASAFLCEACAAASLQPKKLCTHVWHFPMSGAFMPLHSGHSKCLKGLSGLLVWKLLGVQDAVGMYLGISPYHPPYLLPCCLLEGGPQQTSLKGNISKVFIGMHGGFDRNSGFTWDPGDTWQNWPCFRFLPR